MNDNTASGIKKARQAGQMRKDAAVHSRKSEIGRRNNGSGLSSSNGSSINSINKINNSNIRNSLTSNLNQDSEAKKRIKSNQQLNKAIKVAEKIPVLNKYAKVAKLAKKVADAKSKKSGMMGKLFGNNDSKPSMSEIEDANASEVKGEEYNPEDSEGRYSIKLDRKTKTIFLAIVLGIAGSCVFLCIIFASAVTGGAKESYLASNDNPSESDIEAAYNKDEENYDSDSSNNSSSNSSSNISSNSSSSSTSGDSNINSGSTSNKIIVGDSRTVHLCQYVGGGSWNECNTLGVKKGEITYIPGDGKSYDWFKSTALSEVKKQLNSNGNSTVFLYMGTNSLNDYSNQAKNYASSLNQLAKDYSNANIVAVSETPIIDKDRDSNFESYYSDANIVKFNNELKSQISSDVIYCDVYSMVKGKVYASDGIHYDESSYQKIYNAMMDCVK